MKEIDLGLSVKWSDCNLGSSKPEDTGGYYQWGGLEDVSKLSYFPDAPYRNPNILDLDKGFLKYNTKSNYGIVDNKKVLDLSDDAANITLGGNWRIPTDDEWRELRNNCIWTWTTLNGITGYQITSKKEGYTDNSIFLPAAGTLSFSGPYGYYWSSSLDINHPYSAWDICFYSAGANRFNCERYFGLPIRPVCK